MTSVAAGNQKLIVVVNGNAVVEYDRNQQLPENQLAYLDKMDQAMDSGVVIADETVEDPNVAEKAVFVVNNLVEAVWSDDEPMIAATCAYLASRMPELKQVKVEGEAEDSSIHMVFDKGYIPEVRVELN